MTFFVGSTDDGMLAGVDVFLVEGQGRAVRLGATDVFGSFVVAKARLDQGEVVLFCQQDQYFCGAFRIHEAPPDGPSFKEFNEHYIKLAPLAVL